MGMACVACPEGLRGSSSAVVDCFNKRVTAPNRSLASLPFAFLSCVVFLGKGEISMKRIRSVIVPPNGA